MSAYKHNLYESKYKFVWNKSFVYLENICIKGFVYW